MRTRRGSTYWTSTMSGHMDVFQRGDVVQSTIVSGGNFYGVVRDVDRKTNKVLVAWGGGSLNQHDPEEVQIITHYDERATARMASRRGRIALGPEQAEEDPQFVGDPETHGIDKPRGGGFSIMQNLVKDLHKESLAEADKNPKVTDIHASELKSRRATTVDKKLKSRRAMYWCGPDRQYRLTRQEQGAGGADCPKCRAPMSQHGFTRGVKLFMCDECGFKIPTNKLLTQGPVVEAVPSPEAVVVSTELTPRRTR